MTANADYARWEVQWDALTHALDQLPPIQETWADLIVGNTSPPSRRAEPFRTLLQPERLQHALIATTPSPKTLLHRPLLNFLQILLIKHIQLLDNFPQDGDLDVLPCRRTGKQKAPAIEFVVVHQ